MYSTYKQIYLESPQPNLDAVHGTRPQLGQEVE